MAYGSGTLFQRGKKGIWYYQAWVNGNQVGPFSSHSTDRKVAQRELDKLLGRRSRGELEPKRGHTLNVGNVLVDHIAYAEENLEPDTAYVYRKTIEAHLLKPLGHLQVSALTTDRLKRYRKDRERAGADPVTVNRELSYLRAALNRARKEGILEQVPYFPMIREDNARKVFVAEPDFLRFLGLLCFDLKPFAVTAYYGGLRRGELLRLEPQDIHLDEGWLEIRKAKNKEPRVVPVLNGPMRDWLEIALHQVRAGQKKLFVWSDGHALTERNFYKEWHRARIAAGIEDFIPHDSRRSANRNLRDQGVPRELRKGVMGWKSDAMEQRYGIAEPHSFAMQVKQIVETTAKTTATTSPKESEALAFRNDFNELLEPGARIELATSRLQI